MAIDHPHLDTLTRPIRVFLFKGPMAIDHHHLDTLTRPIRVFVLLKGPMAIDHPAQSESSSFSKAPWPSTIPT